MEHPDTIFGTAESWMYHLAEWIKLGVEIIGIVVIAWGILYSFYAYGGQLFRKDSKTYGSLRLSLARYLVVALEFQLAADILGTAIAPGWDEIGQLAAIAVIRTVLNYFLEKEINEELAEMDGETRKDFENFNA